jgi:hypothetical protein
MERVVGIGGHFVRASDPAALTTWYRECLCLDAEENGLWHQETGPTVIATFESATDYFGSRAQQVMLNFRVRDLDSMLAQDRDSRDNDPLCDGQAKQVVYPPSLTMCGSADHSADCS